MPDLRHILERGRGRPDAKYPIITFVAILAVVGLLPVITVGLGVLTVSSVAAASVWLLARRFGVGPK